MCLLSLNLSAQIGHGGEPFDWAAKSRYEMDAEKIAVPSLESYRAEDEINDRLNGVPYRYGVNIEVDFDIHNSGKWIDTPEGDRVWRLGLKLDGARSINFVFDEFDISEGGKVFVFTPDKSILLGSFTTENRSQYGSLGVGLIHSEEILIEYHEPANQIGEGYLHINNVTYGYRDVLGGLPKDAKGAFGNSGACNINVNCPEGAPFDIQKRSVALIVVNDNAICSGAMINNVAQDGTPFFLTANHCTPSNPGSVGNWVFYFNHESATCDGNDGPTNQSVSGATLLARNQESDFALLELDDIPPASFNVCYSGWDVSDLAQNVSSAYSIHHPSGDVKKICFEEDSPYKESLGTFLVNQTWYIDQWELGVTEPGSSGSPLFNQNGMIIGQLAGGQAACIGDENNGLHDFYGRLGVSWNFGSTPSTSLRFWLDPGQTGITITPNSCASSQPPNNAVLGLLTGIDDVLCSLTPLNPSINVFNAGSNVINSLELEVTLNGNSETITWEGDIQVSDDALISLGTLVPIGGQNNLEIEILSVNQTTDTDPTGNTSSQEILAFENGTEVNLTIDFDNWPTETTWQIADSFGTVLYSGGPYTSGSELFSEDFCLESGSCYDFTIFDSADDGICCGFGLGSYEILGEDGEVLASGGEFTSQETTQICPVLGVVENVVEETVLFPNPASSSINVSSVNRRIDRYEIFDIQGRVVHQRNVNASASFTIQTGFIQAGVYVIHLHSGGDVIRRKIVIEN